MTSPWTSRDAIITTPTRRSDLLVEEIDGEAILADPADGSTHRFNETALVVWRSCDGARPTRDIALELTKEYEVSLDEALDHVDQLMVLFAELGLLETPCHC